MRYLKIITAAVAVTYLLTGCAQIFSHNNEKVTVKSTTPGTTISFHGDSVGVDKVKITAKRSNKFEGVVAEKDGYKTSHYCFEVRRLNPYYALTFLDILYLGPLSEMHLPKVHNYDKVQTIPALVPFEKRKEQEKYLLIETTAIDAKGKDVSFATYRSIKVFNKKAGRATDEQDESKTATKDDLKMDNTIFTDELNTTLKKMSFIDTSRTIFPNPDNCLYINSTIKKIKVFNIRGVHKLLCIDLEINWDILDFYKQKIYTITTHKRSDFFIVAPVAGKNNTGLYSLKIAEAIRDNLEYSLIDVRKELSDRGILTATPNTIDTSGYLAIKRPATVANQKLSTFMKSSVSIKVDEGHGSGVIVSEDGLILTSYHVVANSKNIEVIFNDGSKANAELVRKNGNVDLALIKVKRDSLLPLVISNEKELEIGTDVWAIGTPKSLELGQSVSKGIISGIRTANKMTYVQTDAEISPGNSGGAMISRDGTVLGIISSKLIGFGTEGVGFAVPASEIFSSLHLKYKN